MADIRINSLSTTAASTASDDFVAVDGSANGTRKLNAYSPTFGGNLTVSGTSTLGNTATLTGAYFKTKPSSDDGTLTGFALGNSSNLTVAVSDVNTLTGEVRVGGTNANYFTNIYSKSVAVLQFGASSAATLAGNLTVGGNNGTLNIKGTGGTASNINADYNLNINVNALGAAKTITVDTSGNVGLPGNLTVSGGTATVGPATNAALVVYGDASSGNSYVTFKADANLTKADISGQKQGGSGGRLVFRTNDSSGTLTNRAWINSAGNLILNSDGTDGGQKLQVNGTSLFQNTLTVSGGQLIALSTTFFNSGDNLRVGDTGSPTTYFKIGRNQSTGDLDFEPAQASTYGYNFKGGNATFAKDVTLTAGGVKLTDTYTLGWGNGTAYVQGSVAGSYVRFGTAGSVALTLDGSQNATFAGKITANGAGSTFKGTATNDNAAAGYVGEYVTSTVASGSAVTLTNATAADITSISLTAGDWDISGNVAFKPNGSPTVSYYVGGAIATSATIATDENRVQWADPSTSKTVVGAIPTRRVTIASTTTIYLTGYSEYTGGTNVTAYGRISARRVR